MKRRSITSLAMMAVLLGVLVTGCTTGTIRKDAKVYEPDFLTPKLKKQNLLGNPSFENADSLAWFSRSDKSTWRILQFKSHDGKQDSCLEIDTTSKSNDVCVGQTVQLKPKTKYLFSGWAKWENVSVQGNTPYGGVGVNLCIAGTWEHSAPFLDGTKDWTYVTFIFDSGDRTVLEVGARLGFWSSVVTGKVWFDDMCLIELPDIEPSSRAKP